MLDADFEPKIEEEGFTDEAILGALEECPFSSLRQIAKRMLIPMSTLRYHLLNSLGHRIRNIRWVPHSLALSQKQARVEPRSFLSSSVSQAPCLEIHCHTGRNLVLLSRHFDRIWLPHDELALFFSKHTMASEKLMITVVWNPQGFRVIQSLPKGIKWTGRYDSDNILSQIAALRNVGRHRKMIVHADNAGLHAAKCVAEYMDHKPLKRARHPLCSPDLTRSDFYLFGYVNHQLQRHEFTEGQGLFRLSQKF
jgi:hypothetical protein